MLLGGSANSLSKKSDNGSRNRPNGPTGLENECPGLEKHQKIDLPDLGNDQKKDHSAYKKQDF